MPALKRDRNGFLILGKATGKRPDIPLNLEDPPKQPRSVEVPSIIIRVKQLAEPTALINIPRIESGIDLVLYMIGTYPDVAALTNDLTYVKFGEIESIVHPACDGALIVEARKLPAKPRESIRWLPIQHASRMKRDRDGALSEVPIWIHNIPDFDEGRELLAEIFRLYSSRKDEEYTLYTSEGGYATVHSLADANRQLR